VSYPTPKAKTCPHIIAIHFGNKWNIFIKISDILEDIFQDIFTLFIVKNSLKCVKCDAFSKN